MKLAALTLTLIALATPAAAAEVEPLPYPAGFWAAFEAGDTTIAIAIIAPEADACAAANHPDKRCAMLFFGEALVRLKLAEAVGEPGAASAKVQRAHDYLRDVFAPDPEMSGTLASILGRMRMLERRYEDAEAAFRAAYDADLRIAPRAPAAIVAALGNMATAIAFQGRESGATPLYAEALRLVRAEGLDDQVEQATISYATSLDLTGRSAEAEPLFRDLLAATETEHGAAHALTARHLFNFALNQDRLGRARDAEGLLRRALAIWEREGMSDSARRARWHLADNLARQARYAEAEMPARSVFADSEWREAGDPGKLDPGGLLGRIWSHMPAHQAGARTVLRQTLAGWLTFAAERPGFDIAAQRQMRSAAPIAARQVAVAWTLARR